MAMTRKLQTTEMPKVMSGQGSAQAESSEKSECIEAAVDVDVAQPKVPSPIRPEMRQMV
jgi:hypothetical protein